MKRPAIKWRPWGETLCILIIAAVSGKVGISSLQNWHGPAGSLTNDLFIPAIMMNAGHGFSNIDPTTVPELRAFLDFRQPAFNIQNIPENIEPAPLHPYQEFHRYLIYSVALIWRIQGVTWDAVKTLLLVYLFLTCLGVYGICRQAMHPLLALLTVIAFLLSPAVTTTLPILRDFAKAPFILGTAYFLTCIVFKQNTRGKFFVNVLLVGLLLGFGMGFRRDVMIFLPISMVFLFFGAIKDSRYAIGIKIIAVLMLITIFIFSGWPVHKSLMRSGYLAAHDTIMGFSSFSDHELKLVRPASYEKHYLLNDMYSSIKTHYAAGMGATFPKAVYQERAAEPAFDFEVKRAYVQKIITTFPADMIARAYAAVLNTTAGLTSTPFGLERFGFWFACIAFLLIAAQSPLRAWLLLAMLCCFCGYTSIQYALRHAFHTSFIPFFFLGFILHHAIAYASQYFSSQKNKTVSKTLKQQKHPLLTLYCRATTWLVLTAIFFYLPLAVAEYIQHDKVETIRASYESASIEPVDYTCLHWEDQPLIAPITTINASGFEGKCLLEDFNIGILVASFENIETPLDLRAIYEWEDGIGDFGGPLNVQVLEEDGKTGPVKLFFPIHEKINDNANWSRFIGLSMSQTALAGFKGLYEVKDLSNLSLLFNMLLPENTADFIYSQPLSIPWKGRSWTPYNAGSFLTGYSSAWPIKTAIENKDIDQAAILAETAMNKYQGSIIFTVLLAETFELQGQIDEAHHVLGTLLETFPQIPVSYTQVDHYFDQRGGIIRRISGWSAIVAAYPDLELAKSYLMNAKNESNTPIHQ